jgi:alcohol dehydrogenase, propanol-preferring
MPVMRAMLLDAPGRPLRLAELPVPEPGISEVRISVRACAVCRTDLHVADGELAEEKRPLVLGHQIVGVVDALGPAVSGLAAGARVGLSWLGFACGACRYCVSGRENLCDRARFTGYHLDGGFADYAVAAAAFCLPLSGGLGDTETAPLLCAGAIGYRALRMAGDAERLGIYGFGAAAHLVTQVARHQGRSVYAFTRPGDAEAQRFARRLGAEWVGGSDERPPRELDAAIVFAPVGALVPAALGAVAKGGTVVCGGIHMSDVPSFPYALLWGERVVRSVANLTRRDAQELLTLAPQVPTIPEVHLYPLERAGEALRDLRQGAFSGSAVLRVTDE